MPVVAWSSLASLLLALPGLAAAQGAPAAEPAAPAPATVAAPPPAAPAPAAAAPAIEVKPYGVVNVNVFRNFGQFKAQDYPGQVTSQREGAFFAQARQSRIGLAVKVPGENLLNATLTGRVEFDFMGPGTTVMNSAVMRLRYAYVQSETDLGAAGRLGLLLGQTDGLVNPLHPETVGYVASPLFMQAGNYFRRSAQLRATLDHPAAPGLGVKAEVAALSPSDADGNKLDYGAGNRSGRPDLEARLSAAWTPAADWSATAGVSGHVNRRTYNGATFKADGATESVTASTLGVDADLNATKVLNLRGEWFTAKGTDDAYAGMVAPSVSGGPGSWRPVATTGYWFQVNVKPVPALCLSYAMGHEEADASTYAPPADGDTNRLRNDMLYAGATVHLGKAWRVGVEFVQTTGKARAATAGNLGATAELTGQQIGLSTQLRF